MYQSNSCHFFFSLSNFILQAAFTYEEAQMKIDDKTQNDALAIGLRGLNKMAKILKQKRTDNG